MRSFSKQYSYFSFQSKKKNVSSANVPYPTPPVMAKNVQSWKKLPPILQKNNFDTWSRKIGRTPYETLPNHPQSNVIAERMVRTVKMVLKAFEPYRDTMRFKVIYVVVRHPTPFRIIPHLSHVILLVQLLGHESYKGIIWKKTGRKDRRPIYLLYFASTSGFNNHPVGKETFPEYKWNGCGSQSNY